MSYPKPWELTDEQAENILRDIYLEKQRTYEDICLESTFVRFDFFVRPGAHLNYLSGALATWLEERTGARMGKHYHLQMPQNSSERSFIIFYRDNDAMVFKLAFGTEVLEVIKED